MVSPTHAQTLSQHEDSSVLGQQERTYLEEERLRVLARVDELKTRVTDLEQQIQESRQEVRLCPKPANLFDASTKYTYLPSVPS